MTETETQARPDDREALIAAVGKAIDEWRCSDTAFITVAVANYLIADGWTRRGVTSADRDDNIIDFATRIITEIESLLDARAPGAERGEELVGLIIDYGQAMVNFGMGEDPLNRATRIINRIESLIDARAPGTTMTVGDFSDWLTEWCGGGLDRNTHDLVGITIVPDPPAAASGEEVTT